jgi:hypothetical protein
MKKKSKVNGHGRRIAKGRFDSKRPETPPKSEPEWRLINSKKVLGGKILLRKRWRNEYYAEFTGSHWEYATHFLNTEGHTVLGTYHTNIQDAQKRFEERNA